MVFLTFWGTPAQTGSLSNIKEHIRRRQVDKTVKVFNVGDKFLLHAFKGHLLASMASSLGLKSPSDPIQHQNSLEWLKCIAEQLVEKTIMPPSTSPSLHRAFLHMAFLYMDLRNAIRFENGPQIMRHYKYWLPRFIATGKRNYAVECVRVITNLSADFPRHIAYIATHNRTVNTTGKIGRGKPVDQMVEHYNL